MTDLKDTILFLARECGFDLVGVTSAEDFDADRAAALECIRDGRMDGLPWYTESRVMRGTSPSELLPGARSIVCLGLSYCLESDAPKENRGRRRASGRRAGGAVRLGAGLPQGNEAPYAGTGTGAGAGTRGEAVSARWYVDDGPMLDRAAANRSGIGWFGKNTNILTPGFGSWVFLGQIITDLELEPDAPLKKSCGFCVRCIDDCPTGAIVAPYVIDNARCISYLTIENRGPIPRELRTLMGDWVFGCDICQDVCPVNRKAQPGRLTTEDTENFRESQKNPVLSVVNGGSLDLTDLLEMSEEDFRARFAGTSIMRAKWTGMQRNACVALGNRGDESSVSALSRTLREAHPLVRGHAAWALGRIGGPQAEAALAAAGATETDPSVAEEIAAARRELAGSRGPLG